MAAVDGFIETFSINFSDSDGGPQEACPPRKEISKNRKRKLTPSTVKVPLILFGFHVVKMTK